MSVSDKTLTGLKTENTLVDVFTDTFNESFYGFIRKFNDDFFLLEHYNDDAVYCGVVVFKREDITRIKWNNNDINSMNKLIDRKAPVKNIRDIKIDSMYAIIKSINKSYGHLSLSIQNIDSGVVFIGQVEQLDEETVVIKEFGTKMSLDRGMLMLAVKDITRVDAAGVYENLLLKVHKGK